MNADAVKAAERLFGRLATKTDGGVVVGLAGADARTVLPFGRSGTARPLDTDTLFELGSVTKTFTATLLADMVVRGDVALEDPIDMYVPASTAGRRRRRGWPVTLRALATHSAGLPRIPRDLLPAALRGAEDPYAGYDVERLETALSRARLPSPHRFRYSNFGFAVLGLALERAAGEPYERLVVDRVCRPLGLDATTFGAPAVASRAARGHSKREAVANWHLAVFSPAGGLWSSPSDMLRYLCANACPGSTALSGALELVQQPQRRVARGRMEVCLGWMRLRTQTGRWVTWHNGGTGGFSASVAFSRQPRAAVVALANARLGRRLDPPILRLLDGLAEGRP